MDRARFVVLALVGGLVATMLVGCDLLPDAPTFRVTTTADGVDVDPGDGVCEVTDGVGDCSLRAAIDEANASSSIAVITVPAARYALTITGTDDGNASGDLDIDPDAGSLVIENEGTEGFAIDASGTDGGIDVLTGSLVAFGVGIGGAAGDGAHVRSGASAAFTFASFHGNGGAGVRVDAEARAQLWTTTVSGNGGGGVANQGATSLRFATVTANTGGGLTGVGNDSPSRSVSFDSSLIVRQTSGSDCADRGWSGGFSTASDTTCRVSSTDALGETRNSNVLLAPLSDDLVPFHALLYPGPTVGVRDSIPVGSGSCVPGSSLMTDQRGVARPAGGACDRGAWEGPAVLDLTVDTALDERDVQPGDGECTTPSGGCALRAAIDEANAWPGADTIRIAAGIAPVLTRTGSDDANGVGDLDVTDRLTVDGGGSTVDAGTLGDRLFDHRPGSGPLLLRGLHLVGGDATGTGRGGGAVWSDGELTVAETLIEDVAATDVGAIEHSSRPTLVLTDVVVRRAAGAVGAVRADEVDLDRTVIEGTDVGAGLVVTHGTVDASSFLDNDLGGIVVTQVLPLQGNLRLDLRTSTIADNRAPASGAGLLIRVGNRANIERSTISGNDAPVGSALFVHPLGQVNLFESTVAGNLGATSMAGTGTVRVQRSALSAGTGSLCAAPAASSGANVVTDASCGLAQPDDLVVPDLLLGPLADNGGPTPTRLPGPGSPLLDRLPRDGYLQTPRWCASPLTDQRGRSLPNGLACDVGAAEADVTSAPVVEVTVAEDGRDDVPGDGVCWSTAAAGCSLRAAVDEANVSPEVAEVRIEAGIDPVLSIPGRGDDTNATGDIDVMAPVFLHGNGATIDGDGLDRVLDAGSVVGLVVVDDLTITGGDAGSAPGAGAGGIRGAGGLRLDGLRFTNNRGGGAGAISATAVDDGNIAYTEVERVELRAVDVSASTGGPAIALTGGFASIDAAQVTANDGGGIAFEGSHLRVVGSTIRGNTAEQGAGIVATIEANGASGQLGEPVILESWIDQNHAIGDGGGVKATGFVKIERSTISGNTAGGTGGGLHVTGASVGVTASTISGNIATDGSGISGTASSGAQIAGSTIVGNQGGATLQMPVLRLNLTIVVAGSGSACPPGSPASLGYNAFGDASCTPGPTDRVGVALRLDPLQDNGGPTPTHRPRSGSPAIDAVAPGATVDTVLGPWSLCPGFEVYIDQRKLPRPQGAGCDIGSIDQ